MKKHRMTLPDLSDYIMFLYQKSLWEATIQSDIKRICVEMLWHW